MLCLHSQRVSRHTHLLFNRYPYLLHASRYQKLIYRSNSTNSPNSEKNNNSSIPDGQASKQATNPRLMCLREPGDDPDRYRDEDNGTFGGRVIQPEDEQSYAHLNVLELIDRPEKRADLFPMLKKKDILSSYTYMDHNGNKSNDHLLFSDIDDATNAANLVEAIKELGDLPTWHEVLQKTVETVTGDKKSLELQLTRIHDLKPGDQVGIIGAGISGLTLAWFLGNARPDLRIRVYEKASNVGGWMQSEPVTLDTSEGKIEDINEWGPRTLQARHAGTSLLRVMLRKIGALDKLFYGVPNAALANRKGVLFNGKPFQLPKSSVAEILAFFRSPISKGTKFAPFRDLFLRPRKRTTRDEPLSSYISRRFGKAISERFLSAVMRGIYAGDVDELSSRSVARLGKLYANEPDTPSLISSAIGGSARNADAYAATVYVALLQAMLELPYEASLKEMHKYSVAVLAEGGIKKLAETIEDDLEQHFENVEIWKDTNIESLKLINDESNESAIAIESTRKTLDSNTKTDITEAKWVVSTIPSYSLSEILKKTNEALAESISSKFKYTTVGVVNVNVKAPKHVGHNWFGYLVSKAEDKNGYNPHGLLGLIFNTAVRNAALPINSIPVPHPYEVMTVHKKGSNRGESFLDNYDMDTYKNDHLKFHLFTDAPQLDKDNKPLKAYERITKGDGDAELPTHSNMTLMFGGHLWNDPSKIPTEAELIEATRSIIKDHLGCSLDDDNKDIVSDIQVRIQHNCIPKYSVGHKENVQMAKDGVAKAFDSRLTLSGTAFGRGVGIGDNVVDSFWLAARHSPERMLIFPTVYMNQWLTLNYPSVLK